MFELNSIMLNWDQTKKLTILPLLLTGKAARLFEAMKDEEKDSTDRIFEILISGSSQSAESMHQEFLDPAPLPEETVVDFARALQRLLEKAVPTLDSNEKKVFLKNKLAAHLPENMRLLIKFQADKTWDQLLQCLEETLPNVKASAIGHRSDGTMATQFKFESGEPEVQFGNRRKINGSSSDELEFNSVQLDVKNNEVQVDVNLSACVPSLISKKCKIRFNNDFEKQRFKALFDGGATNSLIRFDSLSSKMQNEIKYFLNKQVDMNKRGFKKFPVTIKGVTSLVSEDCVVAPVLISIGSWSAIHSFGFFEKYGVVIDLSNDEIMIDENFCDLKGDWYNAVHQSPCVTVNHVVLEPRSESYVNNGEGVYWSHCVSKMDENVEANDYVGFSTENFELVEEKTEIEVDSATLGTYSSMVDVEEKLTKIKKEPMGRIGRLMHKIQDLDYTLVYQPGKENVTADLLSRPEQAVKSIDINSSSLLFNKSVNWIKEQRSDEILARVIELKLKGELDEKSIKQYFVYSSISTPLLKARDRLEFENDILVIRGKDGVTRKVVPMSLVDLVLELFHDIPLSGHRDFEKTFDTISSRYYWFNFRSEVKQFCDTCFQCQTRKHLNMYNKAPLKPITVSEPWCIIGIDVVGPLKLTPSGNCYILLAIYNLKMINGIVRNNLEQAQARQKNHYDKFVRNGVKFKEGDLVLLTNSRVKPGESQAFITRAIGQFRILSLFNDVNYKVCELSTGKCQNVHYNRLVKYNQRVNIQSTGIQRVDSSDNSINFSSSIAVNNVKANKLEHEDLIEFDTTSILYFNYLNQQNFEWSALEGYDFALEDLNDQIFSCRICIQTEALGVVGEPNNEDSEWADANDEANDERQMRDNFAVDCLRANE
ncbi:Transposon Ty3-G Gag-Pol poly, partial [Brachionus plicatilis]